MSAIFLKHGLHESLACHLELDRVVRVCENKASLCDYRHAILLARLNILHPKIASDVFHHFGLLTIECREAVFLSILLDEVKESILSEVFVRLRRPSDE
jgi:hypothetical protein